MIAFFLPNVYAYVHMHGMLLLIMLKIKDTGAVSVLKRIDVRFKPFRIEYHFFLLILIFS